jgi:hypothetical protein
MCWSDVGNHKGGGDVLIFESSGNNILRQYKKLRGAWQVVVDLIVSFMLTKTTSYVITFTSSQWASVLLIFASYYWVLVVESITLISK